MALFSRGPRSRMLHYYLRILIASIYMAHCQKAQKLSEKHWRFYATAKWAIYYSVIHSWLINSVVTSVRHPYARSGLKQLSNAMIPSKRLNRTQAHCWRTDKALNLFGLFSDREFIKSNNKLGELKLPQIKI